MKKLKCTGPDYFATRAGGLLLILSLCTLILCGGGVLVLADGPYPAACPAGLICGKLAPRGPSMVYDCAYARPPAGTRGVGNIYLMHGDDGMYAKAMWAETMLQLAGEGFTSLACDARGFSPGASPNDPTAYHYDLLAQDILDLTTFEGFNSTFGGKFHIVAHDQGARVAWHSIAKGMTRDLLLSFSSLSIPHADVFSDNVCCDAATVYKEDQVAEQYLRQLTLNNSVRVNHNAIFSEFCKELGFDTPESCQPSFWWYNGAIDSGAMAMAPLMPFGDSIASKVNIDYDMVKALTPYPLDGVPQTVKVGPVQKFPVYFACGSADTCDLCSFRVVNQTKAMVQSAFSSTINSCGHKLVSVDKCGKAERQKVIDGIVANVKAGNSQNRTGNLGDMS